jgi:ATP-dependent protease HslVU (ClpYQ) peptidase subunit
MTCIVALKDKNKVYMAGDSLGTDPVTLQKTVRLDEKVFIKTDMLFGFTSSFRMGQIIRYVFDIPERMEAIGDMEYLVAHFIPALIKCYEDQGFLKKPDDNEYQGGHFLLGYRGNFYDVLDDFQIGIPTLNYEAIGCGEDYAKGSMYTTETLEDKLDKKLTPQKRLTMALDAACEHSAGVAAPYIILSI